MCGIAAVYAKEGGNVVPEVVAMLRLMANRGPDGSGIATPDALITSEKSLLYRSKVKFPESSVALGHNRLAIVGSSNALQPMVSCDESFSVAVNGEIYNWQKIKKELSAHNFRTDSDSEVIVHLIEEEIETDPPLLFTAFFNAIKRLDGMFLIVVLDNKGELLVGRDPVGIRQAYIGIGKDAKYAVASERKVLKGYVDIWRVPPGHIVQISLHGLKIREYRQTYSLVSRPEYGYQSKTVNLLQEQTRVILESSVKKRVEGLKTVGILFSGGLDSTLIAYLAKKYCKDVLCFTAGVNDSEDFVWAKRIASELGFHHIPSMLSSDFINSELRNIVKTIETSDALQVEVAIPMYSSLMTAHKNGLKVVLSGQGADELYGGYPWYRNISNKESLWRRMTEDIVDIHRDSLEREDKIAMHWNIETRVPFLDFEQIKLATSLPLQLRTDKILLRNIAVGLGIPRNVSFRPKSAAQHGSGVHELLLKMANRVNPKSEISPELTGREVLGSSLRYGSRLLKEKKWNIPVCLQALIDSVVGENE